MAEYRVDMVRDNTPRPLASETFTARDDNAATRKAAKILKGWVTDRVTQYGELYVRDRDGGLSADYVGQVEAAK
jgi:hypothetical protein